MIHKKTAFTLIEIILVLSIIAILTSLITPGFGKSYQLIRLREKVEIFEQQLKFAKSTAILKNTIISLIIDSENSSIYFPEIKKNKKNNLILPIDYTITTNYTQIDFYPNGKCSPFEIRISNNSNIIVINCDNNLETLKKEELKK